MDEAILFFFCESCNCCIAEEGAAAIKALKLLLINVEAVELPESSDCSDERPVKNRFTSYGSSLFPFDIGSNETGVPFVKLYLGESAMADDLDVSPSPQEAGGFIDSRILPSCSGGSSFELPSFCSG